MGAPKISWDPPPAVEGEPTPPAAGPSPMETFGKVAANETSFGGSPGATARGAWLASVFAPKDEIQREYTRSGSTDATAPIEQNVREDLAAQEAANPKAALAGKGVALANHAMLASGVPMATLPEAVGAGGLMGASEGALRAHNANEDTVQGAGEGGLKGAAAAGVLASAAPYVESAAGWVPRMFGGMSRAARGRQIAGKTDNLTARSEDLRRAGIPETMQGVGQAAEDVGLPSATKVQPMSPHDYADAAQDVRTVEKANADAAVAAASAPRPQTMLPPPGDAPSLQPGGPLAAAPIELRQGVRSSGQQTIDMRPDAAAHVEHLPDAEYPAAPQGATARPPGRVSKAEIAKTLADMRAGAGGRIDPDAAATERALGGIEKRLENQPAELTPQQALEIRRGLDSASGFRPGEVVIPGRKQGVQSGGRAVREQLRTAMSETPYGPAFASSQTRGSKAAALQGLAERAAKGSAHRALGTGATAALLGGGLEAAHGAMGAGHSAPGVGTLATAGLVGAGAAFGRHYGADLAATGLKAAEKATAPLAHPEVLTPGATAGTLDIWAVQEKRKNETDPEYRKQQRRKAAHPESE